VPDIGKQRAVAGQVAGDMAQFAPPGAVDPAASLPKSLVSGPLADGEDQCDPAALAAALFGLRRG
jgi:hypothetical protein